MEKVEKLNKFATMEKAEKQERVAAEEKAATQEKIILEPEDLVIGNALGCMIALGGLLAGYMVSQRSFSYWLDDIVPLGLFIFMGIRLVRNSLALMGEYQDASPSQRLRAEQHAAPAAHHTVTREPLAMAQLPQTPSSLDSMAPEKVLEEVVKRIDAQKAHAARNINPETQIR